MRFMLGRCLSLCLCLSLSGKLWFGEAGRADHKGTSAPHDSWPDHMLPLWAGCPHHCRVSHQVRWDSLGHLWGPGVCSPSTT